VIERGRKEMKEGRGTHSTTHTHTRAWRLSIPEAALIPSLSCVHAASFSTVHLSSAGVPLVVMSSGRAFSFDCDLHCWLLVADAEQQPTVHSSSLPFAPVSQGE
jgi:hypothetical protein